MTYRSLLILLSTTVLLTSGPALRAADEDAKTILARAIKAHGGMALLAKYPAARTKNKGKITLPDVGAVDFTQDVAVMLPDRYTETLAMTTAGRQVNVVTMIHGENVSIMTDGWATDADETFKKALKDARYKMKIARLDVLVQDKGYELATAGETLVEGKPAVGVRVSSAGQPDVTLYFDKTTWLLAKSEYRTSDSGGGVVEERIILAYRTGKEGIPMPTRVVVKRDGKTHLEVEVVEMTLLKTLDGRSVKK